jgi:hypothetical protein
MEKTVSLPVEMRLPESVRAAVQRRAEAAGFASPDEYVQALVLADLNRADLGPEPKTYPELSPETLAKIQEGLDDIAAGRVIVPDEAYWEAKHRRVREPKSGA